MSDHDHTPIGQMPCGCPITNPPKHSITCPASAALANITNKSLERMVTTLRAQLASSTALIKEQGAEIKRLNAELATLKSPATQHNGHRDEVKHLQGELSKAQKERDGLKQRMSEEPICYFDDFEREKARAEKAEAELVFLKAPSPHKWERVAFTPEFPNLDPKFRCAYCSEIRSKSQSEYLPSGPCPSPYSRIAELAAELAECEVSFEWANCRIEQSLELINDERQRLKSAWINRNRFANCITQIALALGFRPRGAYAPDAVLRGVEAKLAELDALKARVEGGRALWLARDDDGGLYLYPIQPTRLSDGWSGVEDSYSGENALRIMVGFEEIQPGQSCKVRLVREE